MPTIVSPLRALVIGAVCLISLVLMLGCGGSSAMVTPPGSPPVTPPTSSAKPILKGLVTQGPGAKQGVVPANAFEELNAHPGVYSAAVIQLYWSQLEPSEGVFDDSTLTSALASLTAYNAKYPTTPVVGKLRIFMGVGTPQWVITATGPVTFTNSSGSETVGEFWTPAYRTLWQGLQNHLAAEYDANPAIGEVAITSCSSLTGEPFIVPEGSNAVKTFHAAGYTDALGMACLSGAPADYAAWTLTPLDYTFNAFSAIDTGVNVTNTDFPVALMASFRASLGTRAVVANHGLQTTLSTTAPPIYAEFSALNAQAVAAGSISPLEFQTVSPTVDWPDTITLGLSYHPTEIEIWDTTAAGGQAPLTQEQLAGWAASL
jgi:hypothetical protein